MKIFSFYTIRKQKRNAYRDPLLYLCVKHNCVTKDKLFDTLAQLILLLKEFSLLELGHIGMLQATQMTQEVTIKDLESEKSRAHERLSQLEEERAFLQSRTQSLNEEQKQQILELEKVKSSGAPTLREREGRLTSLTSGRECWMPSLHLTGTAPSHAV